MTVNSAWQMPEKQDFKVIEHVWVPMKDRVRLSARLWIPEGAAKAPSPVVLEYIPYRKRDSYRSLDNAWGKALASRGIAFARIDVRGTGDSEGVIKDEYTIEELEDGVQCIDWLSRQSWCNGNVGMRGISWGAINTLQIAAMQPTALKAIMPIAGTDNRFTNDAHFIGGTLGKPNLEWGVQFKTVMAAPPDPANVGDVWESMWRKRLDGTAPIITEWLRHQHFDDYWRRGSVCLDYSAIKCPVYMVAGWLDTYADRVGRLLENLRVPRKGLIGPWGHTYPQMARSGGIEWIAEEVRWWRHWLLYEKTGIMEEPMFRAFMPYHTAREILPRPIPGRWISEQTWPSPKISLKKYRMNSSDPGPEESERVRTYSPGPPVGLAKPEWLNMLPAEQSMDDQHALLFDFPPLSHDIEVLGYPEITLRISADLPVAAIAVRLVEVAPDRKSWLISYGIHNLAHRDSHSDPHPVEPDRFYDISLQLHMIAHRFKKGCRIRVAVSDNLWPMTWPMSERAVLKIDTDTSFLNLPIRPVESPSGKLHIKQLTESDSHFPAVFPPIEPDDEGWFTYETHQEPVQYTDPETGTTLTRESKSISRYNPGIADSCKWRHDMRVGWQRGEWNCEIAASCELTSTSKQFRIVEVLEAYQNSRLIFQRRSDETVKRELL